MAKIKLNKVPSTMLPLLLAVLKKNVTYKKDRWGNAKWTKDRNADALDVAIMVTRNDWISNDEVQRILSKILELVGDIGFHNDLSGDTQRWVELIIATRDNYELPAPKSAVVPAE